MVYRRNNKNKPSDYRQYSHILHTTYYILHTGFTLIELLVVITLLGTVGAATAGLFFQTLKGASKAELVKQVKQEGDFAISIMEKMIRNAKNIQEAFPENPSWDCDGSDRPDIKITNPDNGQTIFSCVVDGSDKYIASSSGGLRARLTSNKVVVSTDCNFIKCTRIGSTPPIVEIKFSLSQVGSPTRPEEQASMNFQTTVSLRNY